MNNERTSRRALEKEQLRDWQTVYRYFPDGLLVVFFDAQRIVETLPLAPAQPNPEDVQAVAAYAQREKSLARQGGWFGVCCFLIPALLIAYLDWGETAGKVAWVAVCMLWPTLIAWSLGKSHGRKRARQSRAYRTALEVVVKAIRYERGKASFWLEASWRELEVQVAALFRRKGYQAQLGPGSNDKGVDVLAIKNAERIIIQCKQYRNPVQRAQVSELLGAVVAERGNRGILVCTSGFTAGAEEYANANGIELWDLHRLVEESDCP